MTAEQLRDKLETIIHDRQSVLNQADGEERDLTDDEREQLDKLSEEFKSLNADLERCNAIEADIKDMATPMARRTTPEGPNSDMRLAGELQPQQPAMIDAKTGRQVLCLAPSDRLATRRDYDGEFSLARAVCAMHRGDWSGADHERQVMMQQTIGTGSEGGWTVPDPLSREVIDLARAQSRVLQAGARTIPMESNTLDVARVVSDPTPSWRGELQEIQRSEVVFDRLQLRAKSLGCILVASEELLQDSPNADSLLRRLLAESIAAELDRVALFGNGVGQPLGIANTPGIEEVATVGALADYDSFIDALELLWSNNGSPDTAIISPRDKATLAKLADTTGQPLRAPQAFTDLNVLTSTRIPVDGGAGTDESTAFIGGFEETVYGMRLPLQLSIANTGPIDEAGADAFSHYAIRIRAVVRADFAVFRPSLLAKLTGIQPAA